ncbi:MULTISPECIES: hypothetical protein [Wolbachia]|uniref:Uncharacterized protein n=6 Tax=Wolbachia TaxID=953 RepID=A0AAU8MI77_9RICK|nr:MULTISPECIES: hypothetical protein [Wolbachia]QEK90051.1 hypothetical protein CAI20_05345 [Wolbachia endosymbiont of Chrysomya megacephala]QEK90085.1 hypothetical protein CAI20_05555 [Wolbachia endosymbiont of Chrysomya megacephala]QEK90101.1 hypothetical protein CAI20_05650 [Wolbachia endosymbiont of Chrysomya megacephala]QEK90107.1 hypothetical protein CAI20_05685 [Wolbachia endosymbiont of Chrysomya megacephala]UFO00740.1 hypothetical protein LOK48_02030 [Wolbachia endosymbiont of Corcyr
MILEYILGTKQVHANGGLATEEQHMERFGQQTLEPSPSLLDQEQTDDWHESVVEDNNTVVESSFIPENSILMNLANLLTESEKVSIDEFHDKMESIMKEFHENRYESSAKVTLEKMERLIDEHLKRKIKLNLRCDHYERSVSNFIFKKIIDIANASSVMRITPTTISRYKDNGEEAIDEWEEALEPLFNIVNKLLLAGAKIESDFYNDRMIGETMWGSDEPIFTECKKIKDKLKSIAYEGLINKNEQVQDDDLQVEVDNNLVLFRWPKNSIVEVGKVMNSKVNENFSIESSILQIGESIVRVENIGGKRNYTDVLGDSIEMSFTTEVGEISIHLYPSDSNIIKVKLDGENQEKFNKLKDKSSLGESCFLGGKSVLQAVNDKGFERNGRILIESAETIKQSNFVVKESGVPSTLMRPIDSLDQLQKVGASKEIVVC